MGFAPFTFATEWRSWVPARAGDQVRDLAAVRCDLAREALVVVNVTGQHDVGPPSSLRESGVECVVRWPRAAERQRIARPFLHRAFPVSCSTIFCLNASENGFVTSPSLPRPSRRTDLHPLPITSTGTSSSSTGKRGSLPGVVDCGKRSRAFSTLAGRSEAVEKLWSNC